MEKPHAAFVLGPQDAKAAGEAMVERRCIPATLRSAVLEHLPIRRLLGAVRQSQPGRRYMYGGHAEPGDPRKPGPRSRLRSPQARIMMICPIRAGPAAATSPGGHRTPAARGHPRSQRHGRKPTGSAAYATRSVLAATLFRTYLREGTSGSRMAISTALAIGVVS